MNVSMSGTARSLAASATGTDRAAQPLIMSQGSRVTEDLPQVYDGNFGIDTVRKPNRVGAGEEFEVTLTVFNGFTRCAGDPLDEACNKNSQCTDLTPPNGQELKGNVVPNVACTICHRHTVRPEWTSNQSQGWGCLRSALVGVPRYDATYTFTAPATQGTYSFEVVLETATGLTQRRQLDITVEGPECSTAGDCPGQDEVCRNGLCVVPGETCTSDEDCGTGMICDGGQCVEDPTQGDGGGQNILEALAELIPFLSDDPFSQALAALAPGLLIVVLLLILLPG